MSWAREEGTREEGNSERERAPGAEREPLPPGAGADTPGAAGPPDLAATPPPPSTRSSRAAQASASLADRLAQLAKPVERGARFQREEVIARGGMGVVHRARDLELNRLIALKELARPTEASDALALARFCEEVQVTAQLEHPGIVPVHECGLDAEGRLYFAMKLVDGRDLRAILALVREGREGWNPTRALGVLLRVCEAMAYAHSKGVLHRDLKPGNIMVGHFGEVYVMDWGLARVIGRADVNDIRLKLGEFPESVHTGRRDEREEAPDSPLVTLDGAVVGTPAYMPPEQARGAVELVSPRSDVYSIGAMLYHLLTGTTPYLPTGARLSKYTILNRVIEGPPRPILELAPRTPPELVAICEKAMARDPGQRYPDTLELREDLRAYLEGRVVQAHETGALAELRKWVRRNRAFATASAAALVALVGGLIASSFYRVEAMDQRNLADERAREAQHRADQVLQLSAFQRLASLEAEADELWPVHPDLLPRYERWMERAHALAGERARHVETLAELRAKARALRPEESAPLRAAARDELEAARRDHAYHERMLADLRTGAAPVDPSAEEANLVPDELPDEPRALLSLARAFAGPYRQQRCREATGLFLARRALERGGSASAELRSALHLTLAWALDANLRFDEALEQVQLALEHGDEREQDTCAAVAAEIEASASREASEVETALESHLRRLAEEIEGCEAELASLPSWTFDETEDQWWYEQMTKLVADLEAFASAETGLAGAGISPQRGWGIERRIAAARLVRERSLDSPEAAQAWAAACASIADRSACPRYDGLQLEPLFGLLPLGRDPASGLWEFAHLLSGEPPRRAADGALVLEEATSLVFVLIPGGRFWMGSQASSPAQPNFDPAAHLDEGPLAQVSLAPFLASKYEMTQGQWLRLTGTNPSEDNPTTYFIKFSPSGEKGTLLHPVETVSWLELDQTLGRFGLQLPAEAQWEYLARAGTTTPWSCGERAECLSGAANLFDQKAATADRELLNRATEDWLSDGYASHAPVGRFVPNAFGLHDTSGNVSEWCRDWSRNYRNSPRPGDGLREGYENPQRIVRGGGHTSASVSARVAARSGVLPASGSYDVGARPVMSLPNRLQARRPAGTGG